MKPPIIEGSRVKVVRYGLGMNHVRQKHKSAPTNKGMWCFIENFRSGDMTGMSVDQCRPKANTDNIEARIERYNEWIKRSPGKWRYGWVDLSDMVYAGFTPGGEITRSGFFNSGDWNHITMGEAVKAVQKICARIKASETVFYSPEKVHERKQFYNKFVIAKTLYPETDPRYLKAWKDYTHKCFMASPQGVDFADLQIYIPKTTKVYS